MLIVINFTISNMGQGNKNVRKVQTYRDNERPPTGLIVYGKR